MSPGPSPSQRLEATRAALERHRDYLELMQAVSEAANEADRLDDVLADIIEMTCTSLDWPVGHAMTVAPDRALKVEPSDVWYLAEPRFAELRKESERFAELGVITEAIESREPKSYSNLNKLPDFRRGEIVAELGLDRLFVGPILSGDRVVAVVEFFTPKRSGDRLTSLEMLLGSLCTTIGRVAEREQARVQHRKLLRAEFIREQAEQHAAELELLTQQLRQRNAELDRFAYVASHDLRAPLRGISNLAGWLAQDLDDHLSADSRRHLELLQGRVRRMEGLINGLLEYSRVGRKQVPLETVDVRKLVREIIDLLHASDRAEWTIGELPTLQTPRLLLRQVLHNLISNALHYGRANEGRAHEGRAHEGSANEGSANDGANDLRIEINSERTTLQSGRKGWLFCVRDNGPGIDPRYHERVWEIFQTLQPRDHVESTGIGLSLVRKIVEQQGGVVGLESDLDQGATFTFTWPETIDD